MDRDETLVETVTRLDRIVTRLEMLLQGDDSMGVSGLLVEVRRLRMDVDEMRSTKVSMWQWLIGFLLFVGGVALSNHAACGLFGIPPAAGISFALLLWSVSAVFFLTGLGLIRWR